MAFCRQTFLSLLLFFSSGCSLYQSEGRKSIEKGTVPITFKNLAVRHCLTFQTPQEKDLENLEVIAHSLPVNAMLGHWSADGLWYILVEKSAAPDNKTLQCQFAFLTQQEALTKVDEVIEQANQFLDFLLLDKSPG